jgi:Cu/Zn superoxide dismutase
MREQLCTKEGRMKDIRFVVLASGLVAAVLSGGPTIFAQRNAGVHDVPRAVATLNSCTDGSLVGTAAFVEAPSSEGVKNVTVLLSVHNLTEGKHAVHIHEVGACTPCSAAGSHLDLGPFGNNVPVTANHPYHSGDLISVDVGGHNARGFMTHVTSRVSLSDTNLSIFDANGAALVIHALPDSYCQDPTDPNCAGGGRVACGIIEGIQ